MGNVASRGGYEVLSAWARVKRGERINAVARSWSAAGSLSDNEVTEYLEGDYCVAVIDANRK